MSKPMDSVHVGANYFDQAFEDPSDLIDMARKTLKDVEYDTMVGTGLSGSLVIPVLAHALDKNFAIVRKERSLHDTSEVVGRIGHRWIFVDDFIATGATREKVIGAMSTLITYNPRTYENVPLVSEYVGTYQYGTMYGITKRFIPSH